MADSLLNRVLRDYEHYDANKAASLLENIKSFAQIDDLDLFDHSTHRAFAKRQANECRRFRSDYPPFMAVGKCRQLFERYELGDLQFTDDEILRRLSDERFWQRRLRHKSNEALAETERALHLVSSRRGLYCGDKTYDNFEESQLKSQEFLERTLLVSADGESVNLAEVSEHTIANPDVLFAEWMVRIRGFEQVADYQGHVGVMITLSTPSRMHPILKASGKPNPKFDGTSPKQANEYLNHVWQLIRAKFSRSEIAPYGMRVAEPNHDGTPHWHILLFVEPDKLKHLKRIVKRYAMQDSPNEKGASKYRTHFVDIDRERGSAAGYLAKYIAKNINGIKGAEEGDAGRLSAARRTRAWASAHGIRKFAQIGGPSVTVWRELRRLSHSVKDETLEELRLAADSSNWAAFCIAMGGFGGTPKRDIHPVYSSSSIDEEAHELANLNQYGEPRRPRIVGLRNALFGVLTRYKKWYWMSEPPQPKDGLGMLH
ncbi:replication endonuclease [Pseudidiomarina sediminum]|uniref:replication endonuclease n=1 Tax=Pseudidiomarina sediminum TaxID=431675 RepID=UPI001C94E745|nr:replication endonuclease [Pseudidiomarina sediminum]